MWINTLAGLFLLWQPVADVPNYFPNFLQAREAAEKRQKTMVIFISSADCQRCDAAWNAFTKDPNAVNGNVSTRVELENFDGRVIADLYEAGDAPAWIMLNEDGSMASKWQGGWKDAAGNPSMYIEPDAMAKPKMIDTPKQAPSTTSTSAVANNTNNKPTTPSSPVVKQESPSTLLTPSETSKSTSTPPSTPISTTPTKPTAEAATPTAPVTTGYVLQAGYFGSEANAQKCIADMKARGCGNYIIKTQLKDGTTFYRVVSTSYPNEADANAAMNTAAAKGAKVTVKKSSEI